MFLDPPIKEIRLVNVTFKFELGADAKIIESLAVPFVFDMTEPELLI